MKTIPSITILFVILTQFGCLSYRAGKFVGHQTTAARDRAEARYLEEQREKLAAPAPEQSR